MREQWKPIIGFPNYSISSEGRVRNDARGKPVRSSLTKQGAVKVGLSGRNGQQTRSVKLLVADAFVKGYTEIYNTPIHLDGDQSNNSASNLAWRPRWFAIKYARQFETIDTYLGVGPVMVRKTGVVYSDIVEAATTHGVLFFEVQMSLVNKITVFPTYQIYDWVKGDRK